MDVAALITQLKTYATVFTHDGAAQVAGAAEWMNVTADVVFLPQPAAYVVPMQQDAGDNQDMSGLYQLVTEHVAVIVDFNNTTDRRGQTVAESLYLVRASIFAAMLNWRPDSSRYAKGYRYVSAEVIEPFNRQRLCYQFTFSIEATFTEEDGWQDPVVPLTEIQATTTDQQTGAAFGPGFDIKTGAPTP